MSCRLHRVFVIEEIRHAHMLCIFRVPFWILIKKMDFELTISEFSYFAQCQFVLVSVREQFLMNTGMNCVEEIDLPAMEVSSEFV